MVEGFSAMKENPAPNCDRLFGVEGAGLPGGLESTTNRCAMMKVVVDGCDCLSRCCQLLYVRERQRLELGTLDVCKSPSMYLADGGTNGQGDEE